MKKILLVLLTLAFFVPAYAQIDSLKGLDRAKFIVDLNQGDANKLRLRLQLILETMDNIEENGVKTDVIVAVRGGASKFMLMTDASIDYEHAKVQGEIHRLTEQLAKRGARLEQCGLALRLLKIDPKEMHPRFEIVKNGYVSLIGYQNKGYALLPME